MGIVYLDSSVALLVGDPLTVATHDTVMKGVAAHLGFAVVDPVDPDRPDDAEVRSAP